MRGGREKGRREEGAEVQERGRGGREPAWRSWRSTTPGNLSLQELGDTHPSQRSSPSLLPGSGIEIPRSAEIVMTRGINVSPGLPHRRRHRNDGSFKTLHVAFGVIIGVIIGFTLGVTLIGGGRSSSSATLGLATCEKNVLVVAQRSDSPTAATGNGNDGSTSLRPTSPPSSTSTSTTTTTTSSAATSTTTTRPATLAPSSVVAADSDVCFDR